MVFSVLIKGVLSIGFLLTFKIFSFAINEYQISTMQLISIHTIYNAVFTIIVITYYITSKS